MATAYNYFDPYALPEEEEALQPRAAYTTPYVSPITSVEPVTAEPYTAPAPYAPAPAPATTEYVAPVETYSAPVQQDQTFAEMQTSGYARPPEPAPTAPAPTQDYAVPYQGWTETVYGDSSGNVGFGSMPQPTEYQYGDVSSGPLEPVSDPNVYTPTPVAPNVEQQLYDTWQQSQTEGTGFAPSAPYPVTPPSGYDYQPYIAPTYQYSDPGTYSPVAAPTPDPMANFAGDPSVQNVPSPTPYGYTPFQGASVQNVASPTPYGYTPFSGSYQQQGFNDQYNPVAGPQQVSLPGLGADAVYNPIAAPEAFGVGQFNYAGGNEAWAQNQQELLNDTLTSPGRYDSALAQRVFGMLNDQLSTQYGAERTRINEEMASRGIYSSTPAAGYLGDLATNQANAQSAFATQIAREAAMTNAQDRSAALSAALGYGQQRFGQEASAFGLNQAAQQQNYMQRLQSAAFAGDQEAQQTLNALQRGQYDLSRAGMQWDMNLGGAQFAANQEAQRFGSSLAGAGFNADQAWNAYQAQLGNYQANLAGQGQAYGQALSSADFQRMQAGQQFQNDLASYQANLAGQGQSFGQQMSAADFQRLQQGQQFQNELAAYQANQGTNALNFQQQLASAGFGADQGWNQYQSQLQNAQMAMQQQAQAYQQLQNQYTTNLAGQQQAWGQDYAQQEMMAQLEQQRYQQQLAAYQANLYGQNQYWNQSQQELQNYLGYGQQAFQNQMATSAYNNQLAQQEWERLMQAYGMYGGGA